MIIKSKLKYKPSSIQLNFIYYLFIVIGVVDVFSYRKFNVLLPATTIFEVAFFYPFYYTNDINKAQSELPVSKSI